MLALALHLAVMLAVPLALWVWASVRFMSQGRILPRRPRGRQTAIGVAYLLTPLIFGTAGLFLVLAIVMYVTRNIDWYGKEGQ